MSRAHYQNLFIGEFGSDIIKRVGLQTCIAQSLEVDAADDHVYVCAIIRDSNGDERRVELDDVGVVYCYDWSFEELKSRVAQLLAIEDDDGLAALDNRLTSLGFAKWHD